MAARERRGRVSWPALYVLALTLAMAARPSLADEPTPPDTGAPVAAPGAGGVTATPSVAAPGAGEHEDATPSAGRRSLIHAGASPRDPIVTRLSSDEARHVAGSGGELLKAVENLPGVARAPLGSGQLIVWGAAPEDTRVLVDGVEIPALFHLGGLRATVGNELLAVVDLIPGAYGAEHGRALGGLLRVTSAALPDGAIHAQLAADLLDASAVLTASLGERLRVAVSGRYGYLDRLVAAVAPSAASQFPIARYDDWQLRASLRLRPGEQLRATVLGSDDQLRRSQPTLDPQLLRSDAVDRSFYRASVEYTRVFLDGADGATVSATPFFGYDRNRSGADFGPAGLSSGVVSGISSGPAARATHLDSDGYSYGLRATYSERPVERVLLVTGLDLRGAVTTLERTGSLTLPPREGDLYVFGRLPGADVNSDAWTTHMEDFGAHLSTEIRLGPVTLTPGLRLDAFLTEVSRETPRVGATPPVGGTRLDAVLDPRLAIRVRAGERLTFTLAGGVYHQAPAPEDLSAVFGNPTLGPSRAAHLSGGAVLRVRSTLRVEAVGFYEALDALASRSDAATPALAGALTQDGTGQRYGAQLLVRQEPWKHLSGWVSYTLSRSERRDHSDGDVRLADQDQTHVLALVAAYEFFGFTFGLRFRYTSGAPRTPVTGAFFDGQGDQLQPIFGAQNSIRLPDFAALDLRVDRTFILGNGVGPVGRLALDLYLDVQNVTNQKNPEEIVYSYDYSQKSYLNGLPTLAVLGARMKL